MMSFVVMVFMFLMFVFMFVIMFMFMFLVFMLQIRSGKIEKITDKKICVSQIKQNHPLNPNSQS